MFSLPWLWVTNRGKHLLEVLIFQLNVDPLFPQRSCCWLVLRDETPVSVCWASNLFLPQTRPASSPELPSGWPAPSLRDRGQALPGMLLRWGCSWLLWELELVPPRLHAWRMGEAWLACWLVAHLWALFLPGFQPWWWEKFPLEGFTLKRLTICISNLFWLA